MAETKKKDEVKAPAVKEKLGLVDAAKSIGIVIKVGAIRIVPGKNKDGKRITQVFSVPADGKPGRLILYVGAQKLKDGVCGGTYNCSVIPEICSEIGATQETIMA